MSLQLQIGFRSLAHQFTGFHMIEATESETILVSWSGGKDSCLALYEIQRAQNYRVAALLTTVTRDYNRICMHGVRRALLEWQAEALGLPLQEIYISKGATNEE